MHLDLMPAVLDRAEEVARLLDLGATVVDDRRRSDPGGWVVMADPEGNEFCIEPRANGRSMAELPSIVAPTRYDAISPIDMRA
jgi:glyoxalase superfamily protein